MARQRRHVGLPRCLVAKGPSACSLRAEQLALPCTSRRSALAAHDCVCRMALF